MKKTTKAASLSIMMFAMVGMIGFIPSASAEGVGKGGYQLNLLAKHWEKADGAINCDNNGHKIFVPLQGKFKINLSEGDFAVGDCNATDDRVASFYLPDPLDLDNDGVVDEGLGCNVEEKTCTIGYHVYIRALGAQGKSITVGPTCAEADLVGDDGINESYCSTDDPIEVKTASGKGGGAKFQDISKELLTICVDYLDDGFDLEGNPIGDGNCDERIALFDDDFENFMWNFDNDGVRNTQLRFVIGTNTVG